MANNPQVLIVDEDLDSRVEARKALQRAKLEVAGEVGMGADAVSYASEHRPDAILLAVEEPVTRPLDTAESLANVLPQTPLIFYSSLSDLESARRAMLSGARDYLTKPLQSERLRQAVLRALEFEERRQMREAGQLAGTAVRGTVITVTGAKGGIGKSILTVNLALALRRSLQRKVVIVDMDTHFGDVATMLDVTPERTAASLLGELDRADRVSIGNYLVPGPEGLQILATPNVDELTWDDYGPENVRKIVDLLSLTQDFVLIDTSGSFDKYTRAAVEASTIVIVLTTGEVSSVRDTMMALQRLEKWSVGPEKIKIVLNRGARAEGTKMADLEKALKHTVFWELPRDGAIPRSVQLGQPVATGKPKSAAAQSVYALAKVIGGTAVEPAREKARLPILSAKRTES